MKVKRLRYAKFFHNPTSLLPFKIKGRGNREDNWGFSKLTKREALSFVMFFIKHASLTSKERLDLHQCIMDEQYTQKRSKS